MAKSADMAVKDPHGVIITLVSVTVVFSALIILYFAYTFTGKIASGDLDLKRIFRTRGTGSSRKSGKAGKTTGAGPTEEEAAAISLALDQEFNGETYAAIAMALHQYMNDTVHDIESYVITIKRK